jgi:hypothetical protein
MFSRGEYDDVFWDVSMWSLMMEAVNASETSVALYETTLRNFQKTYLRQKLLWCL